MAFDVGVYDAPKESILVGQAGHERMRNRLMSDDVVGVRPKGAAAGQAQATMMQDILPPVSVKTRRLLAKHSASISEAAAEAMLADHPMEHLGPEAEKIIASGLGYTLRMLEGFALTREPAAIEYQLAWAATRHPSDGLQPDDIMRGFLHLRTALTAPLPVSAVNELLPYIDALVGGQQAYVGHKEEESS